MEAGAVQKSSTPVIYGPESSGKAALRAVGATPRMIKIHGSDPPS